MKTCCYKKNGEYSNIDKIKNLEDENDLFGSFIRTDLDPEKVDIEKFLSNDVLNKDQINDLQCILDNNCDEISPTLMSQLIILLSRSFDDSDQKKNWQILWIMVYILNKKETFNICYKPFVSSISVHFLSMNFNKNIFIQSLFLIDILTEMTSFRINDEKSLILLSLLKDPLFESEYKILILKIFSRHFDIKISEEMLLQIYLTTKSLLVNGDPSVKSSSLRFIQKFLYKFQKNISNDDLQLYYSYANSKIVNLSIDGIQVFYVYAKNAVNITQLIEFQLVEKLLNLVLFPNPRVCKFVFDVLDVLSFQSNVLADQIFRNLHLAAFFDSSLSIQKSVLKIILNLSKFKIINSLFEISNDAFEFVMLFFECDDENVILTSILIINAFLPELCKLLDKDQINLFESLALHCNSDISNHSKALLNSFKSMSK